jgi:hypothetical protein
VSLVANDSCHAVQCPMNLQFNAMNLRHMTGAGHGIPNSAIAGSGRGVIAQSV